MSKKRIYTPENEKAAAELRAEVEKRPQVQLRVGFPTRAFAEFRDT